MSSASGDHAPQAAVPTRVDPWTPPAGAATGDAPALIAPATASQATASPAAASMWQSGTPLGGVTPATQRAQEVSPRRDLVLTAILLLASLASGAASLMGWRDVGPFVSGSETGWRQFDGSLGRGWVAVLCAILLALAGVLVAAERQRSGRLLASFTGVALMVFSVLEWGLGVRNVRTGPGLGLWMLFVVGLLVVVAVGSLSPPDGAD